MSVSTVGLTTSTADRRRRAGQRVFIGIAGPSISGEERALIREIQPGGFILFKRNVEEPAQVRELNRELASLLPVSHPPLRSIDQEGGRVQRVRAPATVWPPMLWVGHVNDLRLTRNIGAAMARELRAMEFDLDFAPVGDVLSNPKNPVIGDRAFGTGPDAVSDQIEAFIEGLQGEGLIGSVKHFPGHGDTSVDSHLELPVVERDPPDLEQVELRPFVRAIQAGIGTVMTAHVMFPGWDEKLPATMSDRIIRGILRKKLRFGGLVLSDDLEMKAVRGRWPLEMQLDLASRASVDVFLCCKEPQLQVEAFETLVRLQENDPREDDRSTDAVRRLFSLRERFLIGRSPSPGLDVVGCAAHRELALRAEAQGKA